MTERSKQFIKRYENLTLHAKKFVCLTGYLFINIFLTAVTPQLIGGLRDCEKTGFYFKSTEDSPVPYPLAILPSVYIHF